MNTSIPTLAEAKQHAKNLRDQLAEKGTEISHSNALERVAAQYGYRDWNTFHVAVGNRPPDGFVAGERLRGTYLSQPIAGTVVAVEMVRPGWFRLELDLDVAVDVVTFDSFSNFRKRIRGVVGPMGTSVEKTSDGVPHLEIEM